MLSAPASSAACGPTRLGKDLLKDSDRDLSMVAAKHMDLVYCAAERH